MHHLTDAIFSNAHLKLLNKAVKRAMFHTSTNLFPPRPAVKWGRKWLVDFDAGKTNCFVGPLI